MKVLFVCILVCLAVSALARPDEQKAKMNAIVDACVKNSGVDFDLVLKARRNEFVDDDKLKEYILCFFTKLGFQKDSVLQKNVFLSIVPADKEAISAAAFDKCAKKEVSPQETAYKAWKCFMENIPDIFQI